MNDYIIVGLGAIVAATALFFGVRVWFGSGLMTRMFRVLMPSIGSTAYIGFVLGKQGLSPAILVISFATAIVFIIFMVLVIQRTIIARIQQQSDTILRVVNSLSAASQQAAASAEEQASAVAQVTSSVEEIHQMSQSSAEASQEVVRVANDAVSQGHQGVASVREVVEIMKRFALATDFVQVVDNVAGQSNLLAVNAGIEAAKAAEYGRGFSVVASEVRSLAEQSREAASQIREVFEQSNRGQEALVKTESVITGLGAVLTDTSDRVRQISGASIQQSAGIKQISDAMGNLSQGGKDTAATSRQIKDAAAELTQVSHQLADLIHGRSGFKKGSA